MSTDSIYWAKGEVEYLLLDRQKIELDISKLHDELDQINADIAKVLQRQGLNGLLEPNMAKLRKWLKE